MKIVVAVLLFVTCVSSADINRALAQPLLFSYDFADKTAGNEAPIHGGYLSVDADTPGVTARLKGGLPAQHTVSFWFRVKQYPDGGAGQYDDASPMTLFVFDDADASWSYFLRLHKKRLLLAMHPRGGGRDVVLKGSHTIEPGKWYHVAYVDNGPRSDSALSQRQFGRQG